jgi:hypothetical protein
VELVTKVIPWPRGWQPIYLRPVGDIQYSGDDKDTALSHLRRDLEETLDLGGWFVGMGDYIDFASPSNRQRIAGAALYDTAMKIMSAKALDLTLEVARILKPTKGRWLGLLQGHHWYPMQSGDTSDMRLCQMLDAPYLGTSAFIRIQIQRGSSRNNVVIFAHHGVGGGAKQASPLNKLENLLPYIGATDLMLMGHTTKMPAAPINRIEPRWDGPNAPDLIHRKLLLVNTGGYSKAYVEGAREGQVPRGGYAEQAMYPPSIVGSPLIRIKAGRDRKNYADTFAPEISVEL